MYRGKHMKKRKRISGKTGVLFASLALIVAVAVGATVAYLIDDTSSVENTFQPAKVSCEIKETFNGNVKSDVYIQNTSNIDAFIRAEIIVNWVNKDGEIVPAPAGYSYEVTLGSGWASSGDYYYYTQKIAPDGNTTDLIESIAPVYPDGITIDTAEYFLQVDILADAIQAEPVSVVQAQWGYTPAG